MGKRRGIFKLDFPILPLNEETDEERVFLDLDLKKQACCSIFTTTIFLSSMELKKID
jgi:hypothetical protein